MWFVLHHVLLQMLYQMGAVHPVTSDELFPPHFSFQLSQVQLTTSSYYSSFFVDKRKRYST